MGQRRLNDHGRLRNDELRPEDPDGASRPRHPPADPAQRHHGAPGPYRLLRCSPDAAGAHGALATIQGRRRRPPRRSCRAGRGSTRTDAYKAAEVLFTGVSAGRHGDPLEAACPGNVAAGRHPAATLAYAALRAAAARRRQAEPALRGDDGGLARVRRTGHPARRGRSLGAPTSTSRCGTSLSFGSDFLDAGNYYDPAPDIGVGRRGARGDPRAHDRLDPRTRTRPGGVGIGNGFANQRPWDVGRHQPAGLDRDRQASLPGPAALPG